MSPPRPKYHDDAIIARFNVSDLRFYCLLPSESSSELRRGMSVKFLCLRGTTGTKCHFPWMLAGERQFLLGVDEILYIPHPAQTDMTN